MSAFDRVQNSILISENSRMCTFVGKFQNSPISIFDSENFRKYTVDGTFWNPPFLFLSLSFLECVNLTEHSRNPPIAVPALYCRKPQAGKSTVNPGILLRMGMSLKWRHGSIRQLQRKLQPAAGWCCVLYWCGSSVSAISHQTFHLSLAHKHTQRLLFSF